MSNPSPTFTSIESNQRDIIVTPWSKSGRALAEGGTIEQWRTAAGMDWRVERAGVRFDVPTVDPATGGPVIDTRLVSDRHVLYRSDNLAPLSVVSPRYQVVQPGAALEFFRSITEAGSYRLDTAGTLQGGKRLWALARTGDGFDLPGGDSVLRYLLLATSYDGSLATVVKETSICVVCRNTLAAAVAQGQTPSVTVRHSTTFEADAVQKQLARLSPCFAALQAAAVALARARVNDAAAKAFLTRLLPRPEGAKPVEETRGFKRILELFQGAGMGAEGPSRAGTAWGLVNAVTEYVDHHRPARSADNRLDAAWFGTGDALKTEALRLASIALV